MNEITSNGNHGQGRSCVITRRACFSSSHRYWLPELSDDDNAANFGPCAIPPGHGHNYELIVSMGGQLDKDGMVLNLSEVKHAIRHEVTDQLDFRFLNEAWPEFDLSSPKGCLPTTESLVITIWKRLIPHLPLVALRLYEQPTLWADYLGNDMESYLTIRAHFAAAHRLARPELTQHENEKIYGNQPKGWGTLWGDFYVNYRLLPQIKEGKKWGLKEIELKAFLSSIIELLNQHQPIASLLHGDLWSGNAGIENTGRGVIFDPASWWGDREVDISMTKLFGGFSEDFYEAYEKEWPLKKSSIERIPIYNLYHLINHANIFGGSYINQSILSIKKINKML